MGYQVRRRHELLRRRQRRTKILKLKKKLAAAPKAEREKLIAKIHRISPFEPVPEK
jgi:uncharacterized protein with von Willebrand factor type A (vWA) domain